MIDSLTLRRSAVLDAWLKRQRARWQVEAIEKAWLLPAICVSVKASAADSLGSDTTVAAVEPRFVSVETPGGCLPSSSVSSAPCTGPVPTIPSPANGSASRPGLAGTQTHLSSYAAFPGEP